MGSIETIKMMKRIHMKKAQSDSSCSNIKVSIPSSILIEMDLGAETTQVEITSISYTNEVVKFEVLRDKQVKEILGGWLNANIQKQKTGTFIPISTLKWAITSNDESIVMKGQGLHFDFFVASALHRLDVILEFWNRKASQDSALKDKRLAILVQRYCPVKEDNSWMLRIHWRRNNGFRVYKYQQISHLNSADTLNYKVLSDLFDRHITHLDQQRMNDELAVIEKDLCSKMNYEFYKPSVALISHLKQEGDSVTSSMMTDLNGVNSISTMQNQNTVASGRFWKVAKYSFDNQKVLKGHVILNSVLVANDNHYVHKKHQFQVQPELPQRFLTKNKLKYKKECGLTWEVNQHIVKIKKSLIKILNSLSRELAGGNSNYQQLLKLTCEFIPEYNFETKDTCFNLLTISEYVKEVNPLMLGLEQNSFLDGLNGHEVMPADSGGNPAVQIEIQPPETHHEGGTEPAHDHHDDSALQRRIIEELQKSHSSNRHDAVSAEQSLATP